MMRVAGWLTVIKEFTQWARGACTSGLLAIDRIQRLINKEADTKPIRIV
jgi:hypothetical protein